LNLPKLILGRLNEKMQEKLNLYPFVILIAKDLIRAVSMLSVSYHQSLITKMAFPSVGLSVHTPAGIRRGPYPLQSLTQNARRRREASRLYNHVYNKNVRPVTKNKADIFIMVPDAQVAQVALPTDAAGRNLMPMLRI